MRLNVRIVKGGWTFFLMLSQTQTIEGVTSRVIDDQQGRQYVFLDLENCNLVQVERTLSRIQQKYGLSNIYVTSDLEGSYRAWCFTPVDLKTMLHIQVDSLYFRLQLFLLHC